MSIKTEKLHPVKGSLVKISHHVLQILVEQHEAYLEKPSKDHYDFFNQVPLEITIRYALKSGLFDTIGQIAETTGHKRTHIRKLLRSQTSDHAIIIKSLKERFPVQQWAPLNEKMLELPEGHLSQSNPYESYEQQEHAISSVNEIIKDMVNAWNDAHPSRLTSIEQIKQRRGRNRETLTRNLAMYAARILTPEASPETIANTFDRQVDTMAGSIKTVTLKMSRPKKMNISLKDQRDLDSIQRTLENFSNARKLSPDQRQRLFSPAP